MKSIHLSEEAAKQNNITLDEVIMLIIINNKINLEKAEKSLIEKGLITSVQFEKIGYRITYKGFEKLNSVILDSEKGESMSRLEPLAKRLKEIFPKGKKDGTQYYWTEGIPLIVRRLKLFFRKYSNKFTDEQIIQATEKYVEGFNGNYQYMRLLKYFILKEKVGANGEVEGDSELISYIENDGQEESFRNDWTSNLN